MEFIIYFPDSGGVGLIIYFPHSEMKSKRRDCESSTDIDRQNQRLRH